MRIYAIVCMHVWECLKTISDLSPLFLLCLRQGLWSRPGGHEFPEILLHLLPILLWEWDYRYTLPRLPHTSNFMCITEIQTVLLMLAWQLLSQLSIAQGPSTEWQQQPRAWLETSSCPSWFSHPHEHHLHRCNSVGVDRVHPTQCPICQHSHCFQMPFLNPCPSRYNPLHTHTFPAGLFRNIHRRSQSHTELPSFPAPL